LLAKIYACSFSSVSSSQVEKNFLKGVQISLVIKDY
ncbi:hypothetical protein T4D_1922, partial [Trichinella pseudospiralis]